MKSALLFAAVLLVYAVCDLLFINFFAQAFIQRQVGPLLAPQPDLKAAGLFYLIFTFCLLYLCILPAGSDAGKAALNGAVAGLLAYGTYELVNKALIRDWPYTLVLVDMVWGVFVGALTCWAGAKIKTVWLGI